LGIRGEREGLFLSKEVPAMRKVNQCGTIIQCIVSYKNHERLEQWRPIF